MKSSNLSSVSLILKDPNPPGPRDTPLLGTTLEGIRCRTCWTGGLLAPLSGTPNEGVAGESCWFKILKGRRSLELSKTSSVKSSLVLSNTTLGLPPKIIGDLFPPFPPRERRLPPPMAPVIWYLKNWISNRRWHIRKTYPTYLNNEIRTLFCLILEKNTLHINILCLCIMQ